MKHAIEIFVRGFCFTRSFTHPANADRVEGIWVVRDGPRKNPIDYRNEEWMGYNIEPSKIDAIARKHTRGKYIICHLYADGQSDQHIRAEYKKLKYRLGHTEFFMVHPLKKIPQMEFPAKIVRVLDDDLNEKLRRASGRMQIQPELLKKDSPMRQYVALDDHGTPIGWVGSVTIKDSSWCRSMYVDRAHRRKGIGKALLAQMLRDDRKYGVKSSVLLASHTGAKLYPTIGYQTIGMLMVYTPKR